MNYSEQAAHKYRVWIAALCAGLLLTLFGVQSQAQAATPVEVQQDGNTQPSGDDDPVEVYGLVESMPAGTLIGTWVIGGQSYTATEQTEFDQEEGALAVGVCAKVRLVAGSTTDADEIDSEPATDCDGSGDDNGGGDDNGTSVYGLVESMPAGTRVGTWVIGGQSYTATAQTEFDEVEGVLAVGVCAKVTLVAGSTTDAAEIDSEPTSDCNGGGDDDGGDDDGNPETDPIYGLVESMPQGTLIGAWVIGGKPYTTTAQTEFDQEEGAIAVGVCVKVHLVAGSATEVRELDSEPAGDCNGNGDDDGDDGDDENEVYGTIEQLPATDLIGQWLVSGKSYTVTAQTEIKQRYGRIEVGACVKLHVLADGSTVREAETERDARCSGDDDDDGDDDGGTPGIGRGELYGPLTSFPEGFIGTWVVGTISVTVDANTELQTRNGAFEVGKLVKVEFTILQDGSFLAREIKTAYAPAPGDDDDDDDDNGNGHGDNEGKAFGLIEALPAAGLVGIWQVGGISYTVTISTELHNDAANFALGQRVKVEYKTADDGSRTATEIKIVAPGGDQGDNDDKLVGFVEAMPDGSFIGEWTIGGATFTTDLNTKFEEDHGLLDVGAFVKVEYRIVGGVRLVHELETKVPPGAGDDDHVGQVEQMDDSNMAGAAAGAVTTWKVGGRTYLVDEATKVDSSLSTSSTAVVNSYTAADGSQVATRITGVSLSNLIFLPAARK